MATIGRYFGDATDQAIHGFDLEFTLSHQTTALSRPLFSVRERGVTWDPDFVNSWMSRCEREHTGCRVEWSDELFVCKAIDVSSRQIVISSSQCRYVTLSYVWGGVSPKPGAPESDELPQIIVDAITVTQAFEIKVYHFRISLHLCGGIILETTNPAVAQIFHLGRTVGGRAPLHYTDRSDFAKAHSDGLFDETADLIVRHIGFEDTILSVDGVLVRLEVRTEPFNVYIPGTDFYLGMLQEGNTLHKNTLPQGILNFLVAERLSFRFVPDGNARHVLYVIMLEGEEGP
ncbi:uncharacterized protein F4812DRAFT_458013 [Daldinia caldariorum]|uniref:uncharacterized protein n=1 Tax=Daldinia caldariorum TaxID=326644 RepID=UPI002007C2B1|nr:uncharacterized protein F4812DRAFT_458013 [Daldinia caldariorum]KAI1469474.1 hypothetical protein F4812DRAFT_458013 [Daldinia caldariorum]